MGTEPFHSTLDSVIKASSNSAIDTELKPAAAAAAASKSSEHSSANDCSDDCNVIENNLSKLRNEIWFHGPISRKESEILVYQDGDFLVRQSQTCVEQFVLTGMQDGVRKHLLLVDPEGVVSFFLLQKVFFQQFPGTGLPSRCSSTVFERNGRQLKFWKSIPANSPTNLSSLLPKKGENQR